MGRLFDENCSKDDSHKNCKELKYIIKDECSAIQEQKEENAQKQVAMASGLVTIFTGAATVFGFLFVKIRDWFFTKDQTKKPSKKSESKKAKGRAIADEESDEESDDDEDENADKL